MWKPYADTLVNDLAKLLLAAGEHDLKIKLRTDPSGQQSQVLRDALVEDQALRGRVYDSGLGLAVYFLDRRTLIGA